ncbi:MAG: hypothetical protein JW704_03375 [Anaerolineaceae bacterium]|nr:hypothetical protein [Anaerolineaceae bacterium]
MPECTYSGYLRFRADLNRWVPEFNTGSRTGLEFHPTGDWNFGCIEVMDTSAFNSMVADLLEQARKAGINETLNEQGERIINIPIEIRIDYLGCYWFDDFLTLDMIGRKSHDSIPPEGAVSYSVVVNNWPGGRI